MSYVNYILNKYKIRIHNLQQPLLLGTPKELKKGQMFQNDIILVPELCHMTGLTDDQRANFNLMKAVADYTRTAPPQRMQGLQRFSQRMVATPAVKDLFQKWDLRLNNMVESVQGRLLPPQNILSGNGRSCSYPPENADWGQSLG